MLNNNVNRVTKNMPPMVKNPPTKNPPPNKNILPNNNPPLKTNNPPPIKTNTLIKSNTQPTPQPKINTQPSPNIPTKTVPTKNITPPTQNRVVTPPSKFKVGELVYAKWYEDTLFYMAKILTVESNKRYNLVFTEYGNEQVTEEADIGPIESEQSSTSSSGGSSSGSLDGKGGFVVLDGIEYSNPFHNSGAGYVQFVSNYKWSSRNFNQIHIDKNTAQKIKESVTPKPKNNGPITAKVIYFLLDNNTLDDDEAVTNWVNKEKSNVLAKATSCLQNGEEEKAFKLLFELLKAKIDKDELSWVLILIGKMYMEGLGTEQSAEKAMKVYEKSVAMGNAYAGFLLGNIYWFGDEVDLDVKKAIDYFTKSDIGESLFALAQIYGEGRNGVKKDPSKSIQLYQKACQKGNDNALHYLGTLYEEIDDLRKARKYHKKAAKNGNEKAMWNLANLYYEKAEKLQKDRKKSDKFYLKAFYLYEQLSDEGNQEAICYLAKMYQGNKGVAQDLKKAKDLYERGVEFDHERCMMYLGDMYDSGNGVQVDYKKACDLYQKAVNKGNKWAMGILADMYFFGKGVPLDKQKGAQLLHLAVGVINLK